MTFAQNLVRARGHLVMIAALLVGLWIVQRLDRWDAAIPDTPEAQALLDAVEPLPLALPRPLGTREMAWARTAWAYFDANTDPGTGLVNSVDGFPSATMWETGSALVAVLSAERLGLVDEAEAQGRIGRILDSLARLPLFEGALPNKAYHTATLEMVDYTNQPSERGLGWSALDMGRLLSALALVERRHPALAPKVHAALDAWALDRLVDRGELIGANVVEGETVLNQEGRVGYEQYAARALQLWGLDAAAAAEPAGQLLAPLVEGQPIPVDTRASRGGAPASATSEPYLFEGLEMGLGDRSQRFATALLRAQEARFERTGLLTAVSEGHLDEAPYFAYATVWGGGAPWAVVTPPGERLDSRRTLSTKAAFAWDALFATPYTARLVEAVEPLGDPARGWAEGIYEEGGEPNDSITVNTNAVVLAALAVRAGGPLSR